MLFYTLINYSKILNSDTFLSCKKSAFVLMEVQIIAFDVGVFLNTSWKQSVDLGKKACTFSSAVVGGERERERAIFFLNV